MSTPRRSHFKSLRTTLLLFGFSCLTFAAVPVNADEPVKHVILISVDGLPGSFVKDPAVPLDTIRSLVKSGSAAEGMKVSNPSVTWPNHTTLVTGSRPSEHGVLFNGVLKRAGIGEPVTVDPRQDKSALVRIPTLIDALHDNGKLVAGINWPCTRNSKSFAIDIPDSPDAMQFSTPSFIDELIEAKLVPADIRESFGKLSPLVRDQIWTVAACHALRKHRPALTLLHLLNLDAVHHRYGPGTWAGNSASVVADMRIQEVLKTLDEAGMRDSTAIFVVSDHGFNSIPKTLNPNVVLRKEGWLTVEGNRLAAARAQVIPEGGTAMLYLTNPETIKDDRQKLKSLFESMEGIESVVTPDQFAEFGYPLPDEYSQMADLILAAKNGYGFNGTFVGDEWVTKSDSTLGTHGFLSTNPLMNATFVASGAGIRTGVQLGVIENIQVAPTIAKLLNVPLKDPQGAPIVEILKSSSTAQAPTR